ncbi:MAG: hypothetical protein FLDDKLPJ_02122 [Phycisphaerae bacterium]|nr:hypothetical protein [Phycisphaerae bacterium]
MTRSTVRFLNVAVLARRGAAVGAAQRRPASAPAAALLITLALSGCASTPRETPWVAPPRVAWDDLTPSPVPVVRDGYRILDEAPTHGRFPCAMSVSRMASEVLDADQDGPLVVPATPHNEFLIWNNLFDNLPAVSEAFPVVERNLGERPADAALVLSAARAFHAGVSMIYAVNAVAQDRYEMLGVLHDAATGQPIAVLHAEGERAPRPEDYETTYNNVDAWDYEARALARRKFKKLAVACLRDLIANDVPQKTKAPEGWVPDRPLAPVHWPPRYFHP